MEYPLDHMDERGQSPWRKAKTMQPSSQQALNSFVGSGPLPLFSPASQSMLGPETPGENSFFQCANNEDFQRQAALSHTSIFQRANRNRDISSEHTFLPSSQSSLDTLQVLCHYEDSQNNSLLEKQSDKEIYNEKISKGVVTPTPSHRPPRKVPVFKTARSKTSSMPPVQENKGKKRLIPLSKEDTTEKHVGFTQSQTSAFKPVSRRDTKEYDNDLCVSSSPIKGNCKDYSSYNQLKTQPLKPKFGKSHNFPNKKIKKERIPDVTDPRSDGNSEGSEVALDNNKNRKKKEVGPGSLRKPFSRSATVSVKEESNTDENIDVTGTSDLENEPELKDTHSLAPVQPAFAEKKKSNTDENIDVTGTSDLENESELKDTLSPAPVQHTFAEKKKMQSKKNIPGTLSTKMNNSYGTKDQKICTELTQDGKISLSQGVKATKKRQSQVIKSRKKNVSQAAEGGKSIGALQSCKKTKKSQINPNIKKENPLIDYDSKHNSLSDVQLKKKKKSTKNSSSASKQQTTKRGPPLQKEKVACCSHADDSNHKIAGNEDQAESIVQATASHGRKESSSDLSCLSLSPELNSAPSVVQNSRDRETTLESSTYEEDCPKKAHEMTCPGTNKETVEQLLNLMDEDLWVQCDKCCKWRKLTNILDPAVLPDKWYCTMLPIPGRNCCQEPEEEWQCTGVKYVYYEHQFVVGSVVWARVPGNPWWPAMVDIDPDYKRHDWFNSTWTHPTSYHVTFFGDPVTRAWATCRNVRVFKQHDTSKKFINDEKKDPVIDILLDKAVQEASRALSMDVRRRRRTYAFVVRYTCKIGKSPVNSHSETGVKTSKPLRKTFAQKKQQKESKRFPNASTMMDVQPSSKEVINTATEDCIENMRPEFPQDKKVKYTDGSENLKKSKKAKGKENKSIGYEKTSNKKLIQQKCALKGSRKIIDLETDADLPGVINSNSKEITTKMKLCHLNDHGLNQTNDTDECNDTDTFNSNTNTILKDDTYSISEMSDQNGVQDSQGSVQTLETKKIISEKNSANFQKLTSSNVLQGTDSQENKKIINGEKEMMKCGNEFASENLYKVSVCDDSHEIDEQYDSFNFDCAGKNSGQDDDSYNHESKTDHESKIDSEDEGDIQDCADDKGHDEGLHVREDYSIQEKARYVQHKDTESGYQGPHDAKFMNGKQVDNREDIDFNEGKDDTDSICEGHYSGGNYHEIDDTVVSYKHKNTDGSYVQYNTESSHEHGQNEDDKTYAYKTSKGIIDFKEQSCDDHGKNDKKESSNMESYEQDNDYEVHGNEETCEAQSNYNDTESDFEQDNGRTYEDSKDITAAKVIHDYEDYGDYEHQDEEDFVEQNYSENKDNEGINEKQDNCEFEDTKSYCEDHNENYEYKNSGYEVFNGCEEQDNGGYEERNDEQVSGDYERNEQDSGDYKEENDEQDSGDYNEENDEQVSGDYNVENDEQDSGDYKEQNGEQVSGDYKEENDEQDSGDYKEQNDEQDSGDYKENDEQDSGDYNEENDEQNSGDYEEENDELDSGDYEEENDELDSGDCEQNDEQDGGDHEEHKNEVDKRWLCSDKQD